MQNRKEVHSLEQLLDRIDQAAEENNQISWEKIMELLGPTSFGSLLLLAGLTILAPIIGDIPGVPTLIALIVLLTAVQLLLGRQNFWLPRLLLKRSVASKRLCKGLKWARTPARFIDKLLRPRLKMLITGGAEYVIALICILIALVIPLMELVPFSANLAGIVLTAFGLALIACDGLWALIALISAAAAAGVVIYQLL